MYALRNASVHSALAQVDGAQQLAIAGRNIVDAVLEVMPHRLNPYQSRQAWQALNAISLRYDQVMSANSGEGRTRLDANRLTLEEGDGVTPLTAVS